VKRVTAAVAVLACLTALGCAVDDEGEGVAPEAPSTSSATEATAFPTVPSASPTPTAARGVMLRHDYARVRMPKGWSRRTNFGVPFIRMATANDYFGMVTFVELDATTPSLDALAKSLIASRGNEGLRRRPNVIIGGGKINAVRLAGWTRSRTWEEKYGVLFGNLQWNIEFMFSMGNGTPARRQEIIDSVLASFETTF